jgi:hypothetical protein
MVRQQTVSIILLASVIVLGLSFDVTAFAATKGKKLTYEQAWAHCKALLDKEKTPGTSTMSNERMVRGGACMKHYGYSL